MKSSPSVARLVSLITATGFCWLMTLAVVAALPSNQQKLADANTDFAFKLLKEISKTEPATNIFISPYSVSTIFQMVENGARGQTKDEMR